MPIHLDEPDVIPEVCGKKSALIVPCNMCPAVTVAVNEGRPFMQLSRSVRKSLPWEQELKAPKPRLTVEGVKADVFRSNLYHQWFVCMWTSGRRKKLQRAAGKMKLSSVWAAVLQM
jgi:hypothetical protein